MRSLPKQSRLTWLLVFLLIALLPSGVRLGQAFSRGARSADWTETTATVADHMLNLGPGSQMKRRIRWRRVKVDYTFDGQQLSRFVSVFSSRDGVKQGASLTIYVNPDRPTELTSAPGFLAVDYGPSLATTLGLLAAIVVILCIKYSPKDDYESEVNETLM